MKILITTLTLVPALLYGNLIQNPAPDLPSEYYFYRNNIEQLRFDSRNSPEGSRNMLDQLTRHDQMAALDLFESALQKMDKVRKNTLLKLIKWIASTYPQESEERVQNFTKTNSIFQSFFEHFFKFGNILVLKKYFPNITVTVIKQTQTEWHLAKYSDYIDEDIDDRKLEKVLLKIHQKEKDEKVNKKRYVFFHGQRWKWHFASEIFKKLWELKYDEKVGDDFQFLRFIDKNGRSFSSEERRRISALRAEDNYSRRDERETENYVPASRLFMNYALFGNSKRRHASSFYYFTQNYDRSRDQRYISVRKLFDELGLSRFYKKYKKKFDRLKILHQKAKTYGNMLLLSFSPEHLEKTVICADWNGNIKPAYINGRSCKNTKKIIDSLESTDENLRVSTDYYCTSPDSDGLEFCCILTHDCALDPQNGPRIYNFNTPKKKEYEEYEKLRDEIFGELDSDLRKNV